MLKSLCLEWQVLGQRFWQHESGEERDAALGTGVKWDWCFCGKRQQDYWGLVKAAVCRTAVHLPVVTYLISAESQLSSSSCQCLLELALSVLGVPEHLCKYSLL